MGPSELLQGAHNALLPEAGHPHSPAAITLTVDGAAGATEATPLQVHVRRTSDGLTVEWTYDTARLDDYSVEELAEQFGLAVIEITSDAGAPL